MTIRLSLLPAMQLRSLMMMPLSPGVYALQPVLQVLG